MTNNFAFEVKVDLCLKYTFTGGGWGWLDKSIIMLISAPVGFELGLGAELGKNERCPLGSQKVKNDPKIKSK